MGAEAAITWLDFPDYDLTGSVVEIELRGRPDDPPLLLVSGEATALAVEPPHRVAMTYGPAEWMNFRRAEPGYFDVFRRFEGRRDKIAAGHVRLYGPGEFVRSTVTLRGPSLQGPRGWAPLFAAAARGEAIVLQVADWTGGGGDKLPAGQYLSREGLVDDIAEATDIRGGVGLTPDISVFSTTTLPPGQPATVTLDPSSTPEGPKLRFSIPAGDQGAPGVAATLAVAGTITLAPGQPATVVNEGSPNAANLQFSIPAGVQGLPGAPGEPLVLAVSDATDIEPGGWWATRDYHGAATFTRLRVEMLAGAAVGVSLYIEKNGLPFAGPFALSSAAPTIITGLTLVLAPGDNVSAYRVGGTLTGPWLMLLQLDGRS
jgi:hypothetical protein